MSLDIHAHTVPEDFIKELTIAVPSVAPALADRPDAVKKALEDNPRLLLTRLDLH